MKIITIKQKINESDKNKTKIVPNTIDVTMFKKRYLTLFWLFFAYSIMPAVVSARSLPSEEQATKLAVAVWKEYPDSIDAMVYTALTRPPKPEDEIRRSIEDFFQETEGHIINTRAPNSEYLKRLNMDIEQNVQRILRQQQYSRRTKRHVRISGRRQRIDQVIAYDPNMALESDTPYEHTYVKGDPEKDDFGSFKYDHVLKTAYISDKEMWKGSDINKLTGLPSQNRLMMRAILGIKDETQTGLNFIPDGIKFQKLISGELEAVKVMISSEQSVDPNLTKDRVEIFGTNGPESAGVVMICDRNDYSRVYDFEVRNPVTGKLFFVRRLSNFNSEGFPYNTTMIQYDESGEIKEKREITISNVKLNPLLPEDLFTFNLPEGYNIEDNRTTKP